MACWNDAVLGGDIRGNHQRVAIYAADILLYVEIVEIIPHAVFVAIDAQIIMILKERLLAVGIVAVHAVHVS
jgi:hypothetical protein